MYRKQVRRRRAVLVLLVVACLMLISISISEAEDGPLHSVQNGISSVLNPIGEGASRALKPGRDMVNWFSETLDARGENDDLKQQLADEREKNAQLEKAFEDAGYQDDLQKLGEDSAVGAYDQVDARVVYRPISAWYARMRIDKGSSDGVAIDDAVVTSQGLVGRVDNVSGSWADVILLTDGTNSVTARVSGKGPVGSLAAVVGAPGRLDFDVVEGAGKGFDRGDELVTASFQLDGGPGNRLPADIPIGEVDQDIPVEQGTPDAVRIKAFADFNDLNEVTVLTGGPE